MTGKTFPLAAAALLAALTGTLCAQEDITQEVQNTIKQMRTAGDWKDRADAAEMLGYIGDQQALSDMAECFSYHPPEFGVKITEGLGRLGGPRALRVLTTLINNRYLLQGWNEEPLRQLGEAVGRIDHRKKQVYDLMRNRYEKGCEYSESRPEPEMLFCLAWYGDDKAIGALVNEMKTARPDRQRLVAERLGEIGNRKADEEMTMLVDYSKDLELRKICAVSLGRRRATLAVESLLDALHTNLELEAAQALGMIGDREAVPELKPLLKHKDAAVRLNAAFALARLGDKSGVDVAKAELGSKDKRVAAKAAAALVAAGEDGAVDKLKAAWKPLDAKERYWFIIDNLRGDAWAEPFLKDVAANDKYPGTRQTASEALEKTKEQD
ncbi:MAG TPA: HEAT repeat domain-containing protein [Planctomycetota bacterium]|nr:HEAT repeat domain-containing protein [Planctomycetota bacterium]HUV38649.1 HEAT repeat domain-containing protein [Planctomycetota bacterium]